MVGVTVSGNMENTHSHIAYITAGLKQFKIANLHVSERLHWYMMAQTCVSIGSHAQ